MSRRTLLRLAGAGGLALAAPRPSWAQTAAAQAPASPIGNLLLVWNEAALQAVRESRLGPPMVARALAIVHTCIFDAWAAYDRDAVGTQLGGTLRRPRWERSLPNKQQAISIAAYRAGVDLFPAPRTTVFDPLMATLGYDADDHSTDDRAPTGIGNIASQAVLEFRHRDGANQLGDEPGGAPGVAYSDYTRYAPVNEAMDIRLPFDRSTVHDPSRWQPLTYVADPSSGVAVTPAFVAPHWQHVKPFALGSTHELRSPTGPAQYGSLRYAAQAAALVYLSAKLTDEQKMIAEYWADGPRSELPPGHWDLFAQFVTERDSSGDPEVDLDRAVKLFFALTNAIFDAGIVSWDNKRAFDSVRPITALRYLFQGHRIPSWAGPGNGTQLIRGEEWFPYQATTFPTPPFAEYSSGHSTFSAAGAELLRLFTGSDAFGASVTFPAGSSRFEPGLPRDDVTLSWPTFSAAADQAGISRRFGGIHFDQGDFDGRAGGRAVGQRAWEKAQSYFDGSA